MIDVNMLWELYLSGWWLYIVVWAFASFMIVPPFLFETYRAKETQAVLRKWLSTLPLIALWPVAIPFVVSFYLTKFFSFVFRKID